MITMTATATAQGYSTFQRTVAAEGLAEHNKGCCIPGARCWMAEGLEKIVNSTKSAVHVDAVAERPMPRGNGNATRAATVIRDLATDKQMAYINSMMEQLTDAPDSIPGVTVRDVMRTAIDGGTVITKRAASDIIGKMKPVVDAYRGWKAQQTKAQRAAALAPSTMPVTPGIYKLGDDIVKVNASRSTGRPYATVLTRVDGENRGTFEYAPGLIRKLTPEHRLTLAQASEFGHLYHFCACCGRELTHPESVKAGIGPVCRANL
jgi:hypothetical protein